MKIMGIDPGSHRTGWGIVQSAGSRMSHVASGTIHAGKGNLAERLVRIAECLEGVLRANQPQAVALERIFHASNSDSALKLGHARGVAVLCVARSGLPVFEYSASEVKQAATGRGGAAKEQVQEMVRLVLGIEATLGFDASDALAVAICHVQHSGSAMARLLREGNFS